MRGTVTSTLSDALDEFFSEPDPIAKTLLLVNWQGPKPLASLLDRAFERQPVSVKERQIPAEDDNLIYLVEDGDVLARTPLSELQEAFLMVNVDRYRTGTRQSQTGGFPDVLTGLADVEFSVRGFPESNKEKLLLVLISRFIEHRALTHGAGELHSSFQRLSRLDDEYGTRTMYESLAASDVTTHIYGGNDDAATTADLDVTVHEGNSEAYRRCWFVVFSPDASPERPNELRGHVGLVAMETGKNVYRGMWTYNPERIKRIRTFFRRYF